MWRIYNYSNHAIQIKSDRKMIRNSINLNTGEGNKYKILIRKIKYDVDDLDKEANFIRFYQKRMNFNESYFHKRKAFNHEEEVRVLLQQNELYLYHRRILNRYRKAFIEKTKNDSDEVNRMLTNAINQVHQDIKCDMCRKKKHSEVDILSRDSISLPIRNIKKYIKLVKVHPRAEDWFVRMVEEICKEKGIAFGGKSSLYGEA